jgi:hypothetical protein
MNSATCKVIEAVFYGWNSKKYIAAAFCDLTKAFDFVNHKLLKQELELCSVKGVFLNFFFVHTLMTGNKEST